MKTLLKLARYNAWANRRVFDACAGVSSEKLRAEARGTYGSTGETLAHLVEVEEIYRLMLEERDPGEVTNDESYMSHGTTWFANRSRELGDAYQAMLEARSEDWLEERFVVPWFGFPLSRRDGLLQAWTHSAQHRAQILSALGAHGIDVPDVDYVFMLSLDHDSED